ncbi:MAG: serine/threonine protein kinase [Acidobacteria bacterium]|nr:serine/threonine protein kinase [Acidobacteriota bacterium]
MSWLSDDTVERLRCLVDLPDLNGSKYRILRRIASGGMGTVYLAEDTTLGRSVGLKVMNVDGASSDLAGRMLREARIVARLEHPSIVPIHDVGTLPDGRVFYAMKFVQGKRLDEYAREGVSQSDLLRGFQKVCEAVAFAHAHGVIHRDLKPENIMVGAFGEVLVMDWGVAKVTSQESSLKPDPQWALLQEEPRISHEAETLVFQPVSLAAGEQVRTAHGTVMGTPIYMAPEQALGQTERIDERTDVYALGATLYFLLTGRPPFEPSHASDVRERVVHDTPHRPRELDGNIPRPLEAICLKAMAKDRRLRYRSAGELAEDAARYLDGRPVQAYRENLLERAGRWMDRNRFMMLLILAYLVMRVLVLIFTGR